VADYSIRFAGLAELRRDLRAIDKSWGPELGKANQKAADVVAVEGREIAGTKAGPHQGGGSVAPIASTIRALRQQSRAVISAGGVRSPQAAPREFGGTLRRYHSSKRTKVTKNPSLYPALDAKTGEVVRVYSLALDGVMRRAFGR
jgi:hypothetical protein